MNGPAYLAAQTVAPKLQTYFARHLDDALQHGQTHLAALPDVTTIQRVIEAAFWASLRHEEGYSPQISLAFVAREQTTDALAFARPLPLTPEALTRVAPAVERAGLHLGVWRNGGADELCVWGTTRTIPALCFVLEVSAPGLLVIKHHRGVESGKFINVAVLEGDQIKVVDDRASSLPECPDLVTSLLGLDSPANWAGSVNILVQLAVSMRAHRHGGSLLVVPSASDSWRESILHPIPYALSPPYDELARLSREEPGVGQRPLWQEALHEAIELVAGVTAVDGAALLTTQYELMGFGAKIARRKGFPQVDRIMVTEPIEGAEAVLADLDQLGGTRHLSAAQFVHDQKDSMALVASQDGRFTVFAWSPCEGMVHAHRVESLLL